jgi:hypothetical protein
MSQSIPRAFSALSLLVLTGCCIVLTTTEGGLRDTYARMGPDQRTNEMIFIVSLDWGKSRPLTPLGPQTITNRHLGRRYYFSDRRVRRRPLPFLARTNDGWEVFAPVEGTNSWVRVEGPTSPSQGNSILLTAFNSRKLLHQRTVPMSDSPSSEFVRFEDGNRLVSYKSEHDSFFYDVLHNSVESSK